MLNKGKRLKVVTTISLILVLLITSLSYATNEGIKKIQEAWYGTITIIYNGVNKTKEFDPFIVDGTTYVPLRTMSTIFNKNVDWNPTTHTATVTDKITENVEFWENQIIMKDIEIGELQKKIEKLEKEIDETSDKSLRDVERDLNKNYDRYERIDFDITLKGDERDIEVRIDVDLYKDESRWNNLSSRDKTDYLQYICDDILYEFPKANIDGYIRDIDNRRDILTFYTTSRGNVIIDDDWYYGDLTLRELEEELDDIYYDYFKDIPIEIELIGDSKDVEFIVNVDYDYYKRKWDKLSDSQIERLMSDIYYDIEREWDDAYIEGSIYDIYDGKYLAYYYVNYRGKEIFERYY